MNATDPDHDYDRAKRELLGSSIHMSNNQRGEEKRM